MPNNLINKIAISKNKSKDEVDKVWKTIVSGIDKKKYNEQDINKIATAAICKHFGYKPTIKEDLDDLDNVVDFML